MTSADAGWLAVESLPVGLITWYLPGGRAVALAAAWLAVVNGQPPELRAGSPGMVEGCELLPVAGDFAVNIPAAAASLPLHELVAAAGSPVLLAGTIGTSPARTVHAPLLNGCAVQLECAGGRVVAGGWDAELAGTVRLLRRGGLIIDPAAYPDLCALRPLHAVFPS